MRTSAPSTCLRTGPMRRSKRSPSWSRITLGLDTSASPAVSVVNSSWSLMCVPSAVGHLASAFESPDAWCRVVLGNRRWLRLRRNWRCGGWCLAQAEPFVEAAQRCRGPPVGVAEQGHGGRYQQAADHGGVHGDGDREREAHLFDAEAVTGGEAEEHDHD